MGHFFENDNYIIGYCGFTKFRDRVRDEISDLVRSDPGVLDRWNSGDNYEFSNILSKELYQDIVVETLEHTTECDFKRHLSDNSRTNAIQAIRIYVDSENYINIIEKVW